MESNHQILAEKYAIIENNGKFLANKCDETINSYKNDYAKLLTIIKEKDADILSIKKGLDEKDDQIASLNDKLLSVVVLEHKIKKIDQIYKNDIDRNKEFLQKKIQEIENTRTYDPNFFQRISEYENSKRRLENSLFQKDMQNKIILKKKMIQIDEKNNINKKLNDSLYSIRIEKEKMKEQLTSRNKQIYSLGIKNKTYNIYYLTNIKITAIILKFIKNV